MMVQKILWWAKYVTIITGVFISIVTAFGLSGVRFNIQTASAASEQQTEIMRVMREEDSKILTIQAASLREVKDAINNLSVRIDNALIDRKRR